jgi:HTH-type transcriptional regulator/antitoxin HigA
MDVRPIRTEADYEWALHEIGPYFEREPEPDTAEAARFDVLAALIEHYEARQWPIDLPDPVDVLRFRMEQGGLEQSDLATLLGSRSRASEILSRKRRLTMDQAFLLHKAWGIPAEALIAPAKTAA